MATDHMIFFPLYRIRMIISRIQYVDSSPQAHLLQLLRTLLCGSLRQTIASKPVSSSRRDLRITLLPEESPPFLVRQTLNSSLFHVLLHARYILHT